MTPTQPAIWFTAIRAGSGTDVFTERLVEGLHRRGLRAEITWLPHRAEYAPWTVTRLKPPAWANIAHVNTWLPRKFIPTELPLVATMHSCVHDIALAPYKNYPQTLYHRFWVKKIEYEVLTRAQQVTVVSGYTAQQTKKIYPIPDIKVIHNGIALNSVFQPKANKQPHHPFRLLYVGNWSPRKGTDLLAPIMQQLGSDFELYYTTHRNKAHSTIPLPSNTQTLGRLTSAEAMAKAYQKVDALLFPTRLEGFGLVALEAQACGLPVIATQGSSLPEVVEHEKTGLLCPQDDVSAFVNAARKLADDSDLWQHMGKAARQRVVDLFDENQQVQSFIDVYSKILGEHHA
jgi:glycosyltransferase involved in cell wall biosynthesis